jgi:hypothetical protein
MYWVKGIWQTGLQGSDVRGWERDQSQCFSVAQAVTFTWNSWSLLSASSVVQDSKWAGVGYVPCWSAFGSD